MNYPYYGVNQYQQYQTNQFQNGTTCDERIWVQGKLSADAYLVAPSSFVRLWDSTQNVFYEKRADATGRPFMETFEYKKQEYSPAPQVNYDDRLGQIENRLKALEGVMRNANESDANDSAVQPV